MLKIGYSIIPDFFSTNADILFQVSFVIMQGYLFGKSQIFYINTFFKYTTYK